MESNVSIDSLVAKGFQRLTRSRCETQLRVVSIDSLVAKGFQRKGRSRS